MYLEGGRRLKKTNTQRESSYNYQRGEGGLNGKIPFFFFFIKEQQAFTYLHPDVNFPNDD